MRVSHLALRVADLERSARFYGGLLGLPELSRSRDEQGLLRAVWLQAGPAVLMLERELRGRGTSVGSGHVLALEIEDLAAWRARLTAAGVEIDDTTAFTLYVRDPDGHRLGLTTWRREFGA